MGPTNITDPYAALRRIDKLEADRRRVRRALKRCTVRSGLAEEFTRQAAEIDRQLAHWRGVVARAGAEGFKIWSRADFEPGDFVRYRGAWYRVLRVNAKSVTTCAGRAGYHDGITGRMSAEEMASGNGA